MRFLEIILLISCLSLLQYLIFFKKSDKKLGVILCIFGLVILILQLSLEGYRWQMGLIYIALGFFIILSLRRSWQREIKFKIPKALTISLFVLSVLFITISTLLCIYLPVVQLPKLEGTFAVGTRTFHLTDHNRDETFTPDRWDKRELMVQVWYPAEQTKGKKAKTIFPEDKELFNKYMYAYAFNFNLPKVLLNYWKYFRSNSIENVKVVPSLQPYPLVIISHGEGTGRTLHISQAEFLASHGYVVAAIDHTYSTIATAFPDGRVTGNDISLNENDFYVVGKKVGKVWNEDVEFVINQIDRMNSKEEKNGFAGAIDMRNIGVMGHSFGGASAFHETQFSPKVKAGINMDGTLYDLNLPQDRIKPFMFLRAEEFNNWTNKYKEGSIQDPKLNKMISAELEVMDQVLHHDGNVMYIEGSAHFNFTDLQLYSSLIKRTGMTGQIEGSRSTNIVNQYILDFFNKHLKGIGGKLLSGPNSSYPEVHFWKR